MTSVRGDKGKLSHARHRGIEAGFRRKASTKDSEKLVQYESKSSDEQCSKRKERL